MPSDSMGKTLGVAAGVCVVCSIFVSTAAVYLKPRQDANKRFDKRKNVLLAADLIEQGERPSTEKVDELFGQLDKLWIDFEDKKFIDEQDVPADCLDERKLPDDPNKQIKVDPKAKFAGMNKRARYRQIYLNKDGDKIATVILPVHGKGLWSTMYGFLALDGDMKTVKSMAFYEHGETPGLGGEVDSKNWKASWVNKIAFDETGKPQIKVVKGIAAVGAKDEVNGLSGATLTANGVQILVRDWLGDNGYGPFLKKLNEEEEKQDG